jgi:hypothetical protein
MTIEWPKHPIKLQDVVDAIDSLGDQVAAISARLDGIVATQTRINELEHFAEEHRAGAADRQAEIDRLAAEAKRLRWALNTGRRP